MLFSLFVSSYGFGLSGKVYVNFLLNYIVVFIFENPYPIGIAGRVLPPTSFSP
jgi:hypothetical protein